MKSRLFSGLLLLVLPLTLRAETGPEPGPLAPQYDLRVYGTLKTEDVTPKGSWYQQYRVTTQSSGKAKLLVSKFLRDFTVLPNVILNSTKVSDELSLPTLAFEDGRRILPVLKPGASTVDFYLFAKQMDLTRFVASSSGAVAGALVIEGRQYPYFFDFWDRHSMGTWYAPRLNWDGPYFTEFGNNSYQKHFGLNMNMGGDFMEGAAESDRYGIGYKFNRWLDVSVSAYDNAPQAAGRGDPDITFLASYYGDVPYADNPAGYGQMDEMMAFYRQFNTDEFLTCITDPHGETGPGEDSYMGANQRDEYSRKDLVHYLRDIRKLSLSDLGTRWYGDASKFKSWDDVTWPREREYYGWDDAAGQSQDLNGTWKLNGGSVADGEAAGYQTPGYDDSKWFAFQQPGSTYIDITHRPGMPGGWNRFSFTADDALVKSGKTVYLTICPFNDARYNTPDTIYFNGQKLGDLSFGYGFEWRQYDVTSMLKPGANLLAVHSQFGMMRGPTFLTLKKAEAYPTSDPTLNARWYDTREWIAEDVAHGNARDVTFARSAYPDIPMKVMAYDSMIDVMNPYSAALGLVPHDTGESAFFRPWDKRYGYLRGIEDSSEPSQPAKNVEELKGLFFCMTMEGMNAHDYFINLTNLLVDPVQKAWYDRNLPYLELMGAFNLQKPDIVIARSLRALRVFPSNVPEENDIGRGDIQGAKYSYLYTSERELADHLVDNYKIIIDDNFHALRPEDVDNLQAWVQNGGTLVLNQKSGREDYLHGTTWPVSKLLGGTPVVRPQTGNITFDANPAILKAYAGKTFKNEGHSIDWQNYDYFNDSITIDNPGADAQIIARYDDGKPAIWVKPLGKGRIVMLGSAFYRNSRDAHGYYEGTHDEFAFYKALFSDLGAAPIVTSDEDKLWSERFISNNGSTEMLILGSRVPLDGVSATWDLGFHPSRVFDPVDGSDIKVTIDGTKVKFDGLHFDANQLRYFAVSRSDWTAGDTVAHWLDRQGELWHALTIPAAEVPVMPLHAINLMGTYAVKQFTDEASARKALAPDANVDSSWRQMRFSDWEVAGLSTGPDVITVYRKTFQVTPAWLKDLRGVEIMPTSGGGPVGPIEMAINGKVVFGTPGAEKPENVLAALKSGMNLLTFYCKSGGGNGGFDGLYALRRLPAGKFVDISSGWTGQTGDTTTEPVSFPAKGSWTLVRKDLTLTDEMKAAGSIWCEVDGPTAAVSVNGHVLYYSSHYGAIYPPGQIYRVNLSAALKHDGPNEIAIGGGNWINGQFTPSPLEVASVKLVLVPKP
jgi:hypothetical protein